MALAVSGELDPSWDDDGRATLDVRDADAGRAIAIHGGKVVVAGNTHTDVGDYDFLVARFTAGGDPDPSFGGGVGFVITDFEGNNDQMSNGLAVLPNGKILVAGSTTTGPSHYRLSIARYLTNGTLDPAFGGGDGKVTRDYPGAGAYAYDLLLLPNGKFLVAGALYPADNEGNFALWRFKPNGKLDKTFGGGDGLATTNLAPGYDEIWRLLLMPDGDIVAGGWVTVDGFDSDLALVRYNANGSIDKAFGIEGVVTLNTTEADQEIVDGLARSGSKIIVVTSGVGDPDVDIGRDIVILRLKSNGAPDATFGGGDGKVVRDLNGVESASDVVIQANGKIVVAGRRDNQPVVVRFTAAGAIDAGFGAGGATGPGLPGQFNALALQPDGRIVAVGGDNADILVARFVP
jgi:uncharacterized delta-60 repeat protein